VNSATGYSEAGCVALPSAVLVADFVRTAISHSKVGSRNWASDNAVIQMVQIERRIVRSRLFEPPPQVLQKQLPADGQLFELRLKAQ